MAAENRQAGTVFEQGSHPGQPHLLWIGATIEMTIRYQTQLSFTYKLNPLHGIVTAEGVLNLLCSKCIDKTLYYFFFVFYFAKG